MSQYKEVILENHLFFINNYKTRFIKAPYILYLTQLIIISKKGHLSITNVSMYKNIAFMGDASLQPPLPHFTVIASC